MELFTINAHVRKQKARPAAVNRITIIVKLVHFVTNLDLGMRVFTHSLFIKIFVVLL